MKLKTGAKVTLGFSAVLFLMIVISVISIFSTKSIEKNIQTVDVVNERLSLQKDIDSNFNGAVSGIRGYIAYGAVKFMDEYNTSMNQVLDMEKRLLEASAPEEKAEVQKLIEVTSTYHNSITNDLIPAIERQYKAPDLATMQTEQEEVARIAGTLVPVTNQLKEIVNGLVTNNVKIFEGIIKSTEQSTSKVTYTTIILGFIALLIGGVISFFIARSIKSIIQTLLTESKRLVVAAKEGKLDTRGDVEKVDVEFQGIIRGINDTLDAVIGPLNVAAEYIDRISKGDTPPKITEEYHGDFNEIKNNLNSCIDTIGVLVNEVGVVIGAGSEGKLDQRANADRTQGVWRKILRGVNDAMDGVIGPLNVAAEYVERIAKAEIPPRITDAYKGDFNEIKNNLNVLIDVTAENKEREEEMLRIKGAVEASGAPIIITDKKGVKILSQNKAFYNLFGYSRDEINAAGGLPTIFVSSAAGRDCWKSIMGGKTWINELELRTRDNRIIPSILSSDAVKNEKGEIIGCFGIINDITEQKVVLGAVQELVEKAKAGNLSARAEVAASGDYKSLVDGINQMLDSIIGPLNMAANYVDRISKGDTPPKITDIYHGDFNLIKNNLNACIDMIGVLVDEVGVVIGAGQEGKLDQRANADRAQGVWRKILRGVNDAMDEVIGPLNVAAEFVERISKGDIPQVIAENYNGDFNEIKNNLNALIVSTNQVSAAAQSIAEGNLNVDVAVRSDNDQQMKSLNNMIGMLKGVVADINNMTEAISAGDITKRTNTAGYQGAYLEMVSGMNSLVESVANPIDEMMAVLRQFAVNDLSKKMDQEYSGIWNDLKYAINEVHGRLTNIRNTIIKISKGDLSDSELYNKIGRRSEKDELVPGFIRMHNAIQKLLDDANMLAVAAVEGKLGVRAEASQHEGEYRKIIDGVNNMMDAVINPINEAADCLKEMAEGNLDVRMNGKYQGDHAIIKDALNTTLEALNDIIKKEAVRCLQEVAKGNLDVAVTGEYKGDYAIVKDALNTTVNDLNGMMSQFSIAIEQVSTGAQQVSDSSQGLSQGAAESASTMEQITSSMQEMNAQTRQNADNAVQANQLATQARGNAEKGNVQMAQMVKAMEDINESAANISKIIKAIDEIAFQTNLLALNAAVEAARAGKHGKGFTVVAEEVRNLAQRSAKAAKETAEMIEGSIRKTEVGTQIAQDTSKALEEIVLGVTKVTDFISEIASASKEQAMGIGQINEGLNQVDQVTQQNSASSEELAAASEEMNSQAEMVKQMLGKFTLKKQALGTFPMAGNQAGMAPPVLQKVVNNTVNPYHSQKQSRGGAKKKALTAAESPYAQSGARVKPEDIIPLDDVEYGKF